MSTPTCHDKQKSTKQNENKKVLTKKSAGMLKCWNAGMLKKCWSADKSAEMLECWNAEKMLEC